jgi:hypothetical protein
MSARLRALAADRAVRDAVLALVATRLLIGVVAIASYEWIPLGRDVRYDHSGISRSFSALGNALVSGFVRWDSVWYIDIAAHGYAVKGVEPAFFPLYPLLIRLGSLVTGSYVLSGLLISLVAFLVALVLLNRLARLDLPEDVARRAVVLLAVFPAALFFSAIYTESIFLVLELGAIYAARRGKWWLAGILGALGAATRNTGALLVPVLAVLYLYGPREPGAPVVPGARGLRPRHPVRWNILAIAIVPLGLVAYMIYLQVHVGDVGAAWNATSAYFHREFAGPFSGLWLGADKAIGGLGDLVNGDGPAGPALRKVALLGLSTGLVIGAIGVTRRLPAAYAVYTWLGLFAALSFPYRPGPLASAIRYSVVLFPLVLWLALKLEDRRAYRATVAVFAVGLAYCAAMFATWHFVA